MNPISWLMGQDSYIPILNQQLAKWTEPYFLLLAFRRAWHEGYHPFAKVGSETFMAVSPSVNILWTCDPEAISQMSNRRNDFCKPTVAMDVLNIYGPTLTGTDGPEARYYRRITAPSFNKTTYRTAWDEALAQTQAMLDVWMSRKRKGHLPHLNQDTERLTLYVLSQTAFGKKIGWTDEKGLGMPLMATEVVPDGHTLSYSAAIRAMLAQITVIFTTPGKILSTSPLSIHKRANEAFTEWQKYMEEMAQETKQRYEKCGEAEASTLLECLVKAGQTKTLPDLKEIGSGIESAPLSTSAIIGNIFIFILAGYESSANTLHAILLLLAINPPIQRALQCDLDRILGTRPPSTWTYSHDFPALQAGWVGAILAETMRLFTVLPAIPRSTGDSPKYLTLKSETHVIPANTMVLISTPAVHRNPEYWSPQSHRESGNPKYPFSSFDPSRWLGSMPDGETFHPVPGTYFPFGEGSRACIGRQFAQVELIAEIARIFRDFSLELEVSGSERAAEMSGQERREAWGMAREKAQRTMYEGVGFGMALKIFGEVKVRVVRRGKETWGDMGAV